MGRRRHLQPLSDEAQLSNEQASTILSGFQKREL